VTIAPHKQKSATMKAAFDEKSFSNYLSDLMSGKVGLEDFKTKVTFKTSEAWNGQDAPPMEVS
jgi:hypothetical protein